MPPLFAKQFTLNQFERYDIHAQLIQKASQVALEEGIVSPDLLKKLGIDLNPIENSKKSEILKKSFKREHESGIYEHLADIELPDIEQEEVSSGNDNLLHYAKQFRGAPEQKKVKLFEKMRQAAKLSPEEQKQLADLLNLLVPVLNAANSVEENKQSNSTAKEIFENYLKAGLKVTQENGKNSFGTTPKEWLEAAIESKEALILSLVNTAHPTNFHTPFGRAYEEGLIAGLKAAKIDRSGILDDDTLRDFKVKIKKACTGLQEGKTITYVEQVTVGEETETEKEILETQKETISNVLQAWNMVVTEIQQQIKRINPAITREELEKLALSPQRKEQAYEQRSWNWAGADKDGRDESTDVRLYAGYQDSLDEHGKYRKDRPILDLRENAEIRKKLLGALIKKRYQGDISGAFRKACDDFCVSPVELPLGKHWVDSKKSLFQNLSENNQTAFLQRLMEKGFDICKRDEVREEAIGFNEHFYKIYKDVLKAHQLDEHTPYWALLDKAGNPLEKLRAGISRVGSKIGSDEGSFKINTFYEDSNNDEKPSIGGFNYQHSTTDTLANLLTSNGNGGTRKLKDDETLSCVSYLRRLFLINKFIDEQNAKGVKLADWEEAANFENASDFFTQLYLFQQAGLVTIKNGKVSEVKLGIMPLFETTPEMKRAGDILDQMLASPLGRSYYLTRGKAEFMVGYSDGAKSGGNFASHWRIYQFEKLVVEKFKKLSEESGKDIKVIFKRGYGRGENRGGDAEVRPAIYDASRQRQSIGHEHPDRAGRSHRADANGPAIRRAHYC